MTSRHKLTTINSSSKHEHHEHHDHSKVNEVEDEDDVVNELAPALIFDAAYCGEPFPKGFEAVKIHLDGRLKADLSWKKEREVALKYVSQGLRIFWEMNLGLQEGLSKPLSNRTQFLSLNLSLEHFCNTLWKEFRKESIGLCVYRGSLDFSKDYKWDHEQINNLQEWTKLQFGSLESLESELGINSVSFDLLTNLTFESSDLGKKILKYFCRDAITEYLNLLGTGVTNLLPLFVVLDATEIHEPFLVAQLLAKDYFQRFHLGVKIGLKNQVLGGELAFDSPALEKGMIGRLIDAEQRIERAKIGLCMPKMLSCVPSLISKLSRALQFLVVKNTQFRVISEVELASEWDGLDYLIVDADKVDFQFKRKLQGFCAAGGTVVTVGKDLSLPQEVSFEDFKHR